MARKILLADDSVTAQNMGRKILADAGYEVITVNNGSAALKRIAETKPDVIVLDVYMPGYSGLEVCQRLKEANDTARIPILLTVGKLEPFKPEEARRVRAEGFIVKPFEASELLSALTKLEDKIVPRADSSKPGRFARAIAAVEEGRYDKTVPIDEDSGWRSRIAFPSKKKEKAPEPETSDDPAIYNPVNRDLKTVVEHKPVPAPQAPSSMQPPAQAANEPAGNDDGRINLGALVANGLPKDVTPEEIAALAAAAAQVQGIADVKTGDAPVAPQQAQPAVQPAEASSSRQEFPSATVDRIQAETISSEPARGEVPGAESSPIESASTQVAETKLAIESQSAVPSIAAETGETAEAAIIAPPDAQENTTGISANDTAPVPATSETAPGATFAPQSQDHGQTAAEAKLAEIAEDKTEVSAEVPPAIVSFAAAESANSGNGASTHAIPANSEPEPVTMAVAAPQAAAVFRWSAVAVALAPEETSLSLEEEMRKAQAVAAIAPVPEPERVQAEAIETAEIPVAIPIAEAPAVSEAQAEVPSTSHATVADEVAPEAAYTPRMVKEFETVTPREFEPPCAVAAPALETSAAPTEMPTEAAESATLIPASAQSIPQTQQPEASDAADPAPPSSLSVENRESEQKEESEPKQESATDEKSVTQSQAVAEAAVAYTDRQNEYERDVTETQPSESIRQAPENLSPKQSAESASAATEEISGGLSDMGKKESEIAATTAAAWASWRRIRDTSDSKNASADSSSTDPAREEAAMAVAAGAEKAPEEAPADAEVSPEIASIVDTVLADLRPKIVEEISRKLGKKK